MRRTPEQWAEWLREMGAREKAATPGPWTWDDPGMFLWSPDQEMVMDQKRHHGQGLRIRGHGAGLPEDDNAEFVAHARTDIPTARELILLLARALEETSSAQEWAKGYDVAQAILEAPK